MDEKLKNSENEAQIIRHEDLARHNSRGIYMRDDHCDWGSSGMQDLVDSYFLFVNFVNLFLQNFSLIYNTFTLFYRFCKSCKL